MQNARTHHSKDEVYGFDDWFNLIGEGELEGAKQTARRIPSKCRMPAHTIPKYRQRLKPWMPFESKDVVFCATASSSSLFVVVNQENVPYPII